MHRTTEKHCDYKPRGPYRSKWDIAHKSRSDYSRTAERQQVQEALEEMEETNELHRDRDKLQGSTLEDDCCYDDGCTGSSADPRGRGASSSQIDQPHNPNLDSSNYIPGSGIRGLVYLYPPSLLGDE